MLGVDEEEQVWLLAWPVGEAAVSEQKVAISKPNKQLLASAERL